MPEEKAPVPASPFLAQARERYRQAEGRISRLTQPQLILLVFILGLGFLALGVVLGAVLSPYSPTQTPEVDLSASSSPDEGETVSQTGIIRRLGVLKDGAEFYLEKSLESRILLKSEQFDSSFFESREGLSVTLEGTLSKTSDGKEEILLVEKIKIK